MIDALDRRLGLSGTINEWRFLFRSHFDALRPYLSPTGRQATDWCCPYNGHKQSLIANAGQPPRCQCVPCVDTARIPPEDLEIWMFAPSAFAKKLCNGLGLHAASKPLQGDSLRLGSLALRSKRYPAFLVRQGEGGYQLQIQAVAAGQSRPCLFYTPRYCPDTADWLARHQHGYFPLEDLLLPGSLEPSPDYWQTLQEFKTALSRPAKNNRPKVFIESSFKRITFPDGYVVNLSRAHKRRAVVRFIHEQLKRSGRTEFDVEVLREEYNSQHPEHPWNSDRIREDLFKRNTPDFDRLFETIDAANGRYRLKI